MKKILMFLPAILLLLSSCSGKGDEDVLKTVPAESGYFVLAHLKALASDLGDEGKQQLDAALSGLNEKGMDADARWSFLLGEDSGLDFSGPLVMFEYKRNMVVTFYVKDPGKFREGIEKALSTQLETTDGLLADAAGTVFMKDDQVWLAGDYPELQASDIAVLADLKDSECVLSVTGASDAAGRKDDVVSFVNLGVTLSGSWNNQTRLVLNSIFDDASYIISTHNFEKGKVEGETVFLNYKGEPAGMAFKMSKIDVGDLKKFSGKGNCFLAVGVNPDLMHDLVRVIKNFGMVPSELQTLLESLDGNVALSVSQTSKYGSPESVGAMFTFRDKQTASDAASLLRQLNLGDNVDVYADGKACYISIGVPSGAGIDTVADDFKGACFGVALLPSFFSIATGGNVSDYIDGCTVTLHDDGKGAKILSTFTTKSDRNALITLLEFVNDI